MSYGNISFILLILPPLNPGVMNFQGHFLNISVSYLFAFIIYFPSTWYIRLVSAENSHMV